MSYLAFTLSEESRVKLLEQFQPQFPDVICHHITLEFGVSMPEVLPLVDSVYVTGIVQGDGIEALSVTVNEVSVSKKGRIYHITHSIDRSMGIRPVDSKALIITGVVCSTDYPIPITGEVKFYR